MILFIKPKLRPKISLLIPYRSDNHYRDKVFKWVLEYWKNELPDAEIIIGTSKSKVFCKTEAFNQAAKRATGKVFVLLDADAYMEGSIIEKCADDILEDPNDRLWFVPYRKLYRLTKEITLRILKSDPADPYRPPSPPPPEFIDGDTSLSSYGHRYGAMVMVFPREAYDIIGCFDERFKGWGGEDVAILRALDTLYGKHKITKNDLYHLWHPTIALSGRDRAWEGQKALNPNGNLAQRYHRASRNPTKMRELVDEGCRQKRLDYRIKSAIKEYIKLLKKSR